MLSNLISSLRTRRHHAHLRAVYSRFKSFTMIPEDVFIANLMLANRVHSCEGCIIECGVWRGGMSAGIASVLGRSRKYFLFDSFQGLPQTQPVDGPAALAWQQDTASPHYYDNCSAPTRYASDAMTLAGATTFTLVEGWFDKTLHSFTPPEKIALLRLDGDWYDSTMTCLETLFDSVAPGGLIIIDDYYTWDGCSRAVHDFLSRRAATERIVSFNNVCYLVKH